MGWGTTDYDPPILKGRTELPKVKPNNLLTYTYTGPPLQTGDPCCNKCGGTEFRWIGTCIRCYEKEVDRWEALKIFLCKCSDQQKKYPLDVFEILFQIDEKMKELEEK